MTWDAVGAIAELLGALGVIASFFYIGFQIRSNTRSVRAASYHNVTTNLSNLSNLSGAINRLPAFSTMVTWGSTLLTRMSNSDIRS